MIVQRMPDVGTVWWVVRMIGQNSWCGDRDLLQELGLFYSIDGSLSGCRCGVQVWCVVYCKLYCFDVLYCETIECEVVICCTLLFI